MPDFLKDLHPVLQALVAGLFTWGLTAGGAALVLSSTACTRSCFCVMMTLDVALG